MRRVKYRTRHQELVAHACLLYARLDARGKLQKDKRRLAPVEPKDKELVRDYVKTKVVQVRRERQDLDRRESDRPLLLRPAEYAVGVSRQPE